MLKAATITRTLATAGAALMLNGADAAQLAPQTTATAVTVTNPVTRPVPTQDVDGPVRNAFQQFASTGCVAVGYCTITFPATTAALTVITHVSCYFTMLSSGAVQFFYLSAEQESAFNALPVFSYAAANGYTPYGSNADTNVTLLLGQNPTVTVNTLSQPANGFECTISGSTAK